MRGQKPVIGLLPLWDEEKDSLWMLPGYPDGIAEAGGLPVTLPLTEDPDELAQLLDLCGGLLFTGGHDVSPGVYGAEASPDCGPVCTERDRMEVRLLELAIRAEKPVLGICRGIQLINAALGGTLYQHLPKERPSGLEHHMSPPYDAEQHGVRILPDTPLFELLKTETLGVNSYHHQAVRTVAPELRVMAEAEDGLVEAVYRPESRFLWAVQWHPEFSYRVNAASRAIFAAFVRAAAADAP